MKNTIYFILGVMFVVLTSATTASIMTIKPVKPTSTVVIPIDYGVDEAKSKIEYFIRKGYIVKSIAGTSQYGQLWLIVMEKY